MNSIISFVITLGILIFVHEFGHFILAKLFGVKVLKFSLGFGPKLIGKQIGDTEYLVSAFPLGGYVKMLGEQPGNDIEPADKHKSFSLKPVWQRFLIVFAGPFFNLAYAAMIFFLMYAAIGSPNYEYPAKIGSVSEESPAAKAGIKKDDIILSINDEKTADWETVSELIKKSNGTPLVLSIKRGEKILSITGTPKEGDIKNLFGEIVGKKYQLGIGPAPKMYFEEIPVSEAFMNGFQQTWFYVGVTLKFLSKMVQGVVPSSELGGPIAIAQIAGIQFEAGVFSFFMFTGFLSVNLAILNFLPIPILDGGHLFFYIMEAVRRKPLSLKAQEMLQQIGLVLLISLMVYVFYNDIVRIITNGWSLPG